MVLSRLAPFHGVDEMNRMLDDWFAYGGIRARPQSPGWRPRTDIYEEGDDLVIQLEAPGLKRDDFEVSWENGLLTIRGDHRREKGVEEEERRNLRSERRYGVFQRRFQLPDDLDPEQIHAEYDQGLLTLRIPGAKRTRRQSIEVT